MLKTLVAAMLLVGTISGCSSTGASGTPPDWSLGRILIATVEVVREIETIDYGGGDSGRGLEMRVLEVHWLGEPAMTIIATPKVVPGDLLVVEEPPGYRYQVGEIYVASFGYQGDVQPPPLDRYPWWLSVGVATDGSVVARDAREAETFEQVLMAADAVDGDEDPVGEVMAGLAAERQVLFDARDRGVPYDRLPRGPMLQAVDAAFGVERGSVAEGPGVGYRDLAPEERILPSDLSEQTEDMEAVLGAPLIQLEAMVIHGPDLAGVGSIGLWFPGKARTAEFGVDTVTGVTVIRSMVPSGVPFDLVGFPPVVRPVEGDAPVVGPRRFATTLLSGLGPVNPTETVGVDVPEVYVVVDISGPAPKVERLNARAYFKRVLDMREILDREPVDPFDPAPEDGTR